MSRALHLVKVVIRNFRSIREVSLDNIGDVTVLVGPNESGKSNILRALRWFGTNSPIKEEDIPVNLRASTEKIDRPIVEAYFEIINREKFKELLNSVLESEVQEILGDYPFTPKTNLLIDIYSIIKELELIPLFLGTKTPIDTTSAICKDKKGGLVFIAVIHKKADLNSVHQFEARVDSLRESLKENYKTIRGILVAPSLTNGAKKALDNKGFEFKELVPSPIENIKFLKLEKYDDGHFGIDLYDEDLNSVLEDSTNRFIEIVKLFILGVPLSNLFINAFNAEVRNILKSNNVPDEKIPEGIEVVKNISHFSNTITAAVNKLEEIDKSNKDKGIIERFEIVKQDLNQELQKSPSTNISSLNISERAYPINPPLNPRSIFTRVYNNMVSKINEIKALATPNQLEENVTTILSKLRPDFVYLSEEMELKGDVRKIGKWSQTLNEEEGDYVINARLFKLLKIDLEKFDEMDVPNQGTFLNNRIDVFSRTLEDLWKQQKVYITCNVWEKGISFGIVELDDDHRPIPGKRTLPEARSRGFKWYLAYLITLEYLKIKAEEKDIVLLLDDPGVFLHERGQKDFLKTINETSKNVQILYNTHLISLFDERELDRVLLVELDKENRTTIKKPWTNEKRDIIAPVRHALGFDKLIFEDFIEKFDGILFVEGISDKFIFEGLQKAGVLSEKWYIYPLSGGDAINKNEIVKRIEQLECLYGSYNNKNNKVKHYFVLDGDKRQTNGDTNGDKKQTTSKINDKENVIFLGNKNQEIEDLIDREFYLGCVSDCYYRIFINSPSKMRKLKDAIKNIREEKEQEKLTKLLENKFKEYKLGTFSKVDVSKTIKRRLSKDPSLVEYLQPVIKELKKHRIIQK